jgi:hypothetical protein
VCVYMDRNQYKCVPASKRNNTPIKGSNNFYTFQCNGTADASSATVLHKFMQCYCEKCRYRYKSNHITHSHKFSPSLICMGAISNLFTSYHYYSYACHFLSPADRNSAFAECPSRVEFGNWRTTVVKYCDQARGVRTRQSEQDEPCQYCGSTDDGGTFSRM